MKMKRGILTLFAMVLFLISFASANVLFYEDFEDALNLGTEWGISGGHGSQGLTTEQIRYGSKSYKFSLTRYDEGDYREELVLRAPFNHGSLNFDIGNEYWIGFSVFLADGYYSNSWVLHHQYHGSPDDPPTCDPSEPYRNPIFRVAATKEGSFYTTYIWDSRQCTPAIGDYEGSYTGHYGVPPVGQWCDFVINLKWNYGAGGFLKIWKNGVLVTDRTGGNCFNDNIGPYLKIGIYGALEQDQTMTVYYDELRIGDSSSSYSEVAPGGTLETCQNQGYQCCDSCESNPHPEYDADCTGQVCCGVCYVPDNIIDNGGSGTSSTGSWSVSGGANPYGADSLYSKDNGATYTFTKAIDGQYNISLWWTEWPSRLDNVPVEIRNGAVLLETVYINQQVNGGQWNSIGEYDFTGVGSVTIISSGNNNSTCADAVKFDLVSTTCGSADTNFDSEVDILEIMAYITEWKAGNVNIVDLMIGIGEWKNGC